MKTEIPVNIPVKPSGPPTVEISPTAGAIYIRFSRAKIAQSRDFSTNTVELIVDLDSHGNAVGVEVIGAREWSIELIVKMVQKARIDDSAIDWRKARFGTPEELVATCQN